MSKKRLEFCKGARCARLTLKLSGSAPINLISKAPPLILEIEDKEVSEEIFTHEMISPIEKTFDLSILRVENPSGSWGFGSSSSLVQVSCPMPGTYPIYVAGDISQEDKKVITDLHWKKNKLLCFFDAPGAYDNNFGFCTYKVFTGFKVYKFFDGQGVLCAGRLNDEELDYEVKCNDCCKDNEILCNSRHYPGYTCYPIPPLNSRLLESKNNIARFWR